MGALEDVVVVALEDVQDVLTVHHVIQHVALGVKVVVETVLDVQVAQDVLIVLHAIVLVVTAVHRVLVDVQDVLIALHVIIHVDRDVLDVQESVNRHAMLVQDVVMDVNLDVIILAQVAVLLHAMQHVAVNYSVL